MFLDTPTFIQGQNTLGKTILFLDHLSVMWEKKVINTVIEEVVVSCFGWYFVGDVVMMIQELLNVENILSYLLKIYF